MNIAEGLAYALVAGIEPIYGLYSGIIPPIMAGLFASSAFMVVTLTSEMALMTATLFETMGNVAMSVIFMFAILVGMWQLLFGYFKLGRYLRFISQSVMTGFVTGLAVLVILGQIPELLGAHSEHSGKVLAAIDILLHPGTWDLATTFIGITMIVLIILLLKTRLHKLSLIVSMIAVSIINWLVGFTSVQIVGDIAQITRTLPLPAIPAFGAIPELLIPSLSTAILGVAVAVAVSQNYTNPDGDYPNSNKDFIGLGVANTVGGIFQSPPTTGSLSRTATIVGAGAKSRFALILSGLLMAAVLVTVGPLAEYIPMAALAGLLIFVSFEAVNHLRILRGWKTHIVGRIAMVFTFVLTLTIDLITALIAGIVISLALFIYQSSKDVRVRELDEVDEGKFKEGKTPAKFPSNQVTVLQFYGSASFAAVDTMEKRLPSVEGVKNAAVILVKRGREEVGNTYLSWLHLYANKLHRTGNTLFLAELEPPVRDQMEKAGFIEAVGKENVFLAQPVIGASISEAIKAANEWLKKNQKI